LKNEVRPTGEIHPFADRFPMMSSERLSDLAEDIRENGLREPIVLDGAGVLIDGRNRLAACAEAGVAPVFRVCDGDPVAYIISANLARRDLTATQRAVIAAEYRFTVNQTQREAARTFGLGEKSNGLVGMAAVVLTHAPDLRDGLMSGATMMRSAYEDAQKRKAAAESDAAKRARLEAEAPELLAMVDERELTLAGAIAELDERKRQAAERAREYRERQEAETCNLVRLVEDAAVGFLSERRRAEARDLFDPTLSASRFRVTAATLRTAAENLGKLADIWERQEETQ